MNRGELRTRAYFHLGQTEARSNFTVAQVNSMLNEAYFKINRMYPWPFREKWSTMSTVVGTSEYYLPSDCRKLVTMRQLSTPTRIDIIDKMDFDTDIPDPSLAGQNHPWKCMLFGLDMTQIADTAANGTNATTVVGASASLSSTNDAYNDWLLVNRHSTHYGYSRISDYVGATKTFTLTDAIASQTNTDAYHIVRQLKKFVLWPTPSTAITLYLKYIRRIASLSSDYSVPEWTPDADDFHDVIARYAAHLLMVPIDAGKSKNHLDLAMGVLEEMRQALYATASGKVDVVRSMEQSGSSWSKLPGNYPTVR